MILVDILLFKDPDLDPVFSGIRIRVAEKSRIRICIHCLKGLFFYAFPNSEPDLVSALNCGFIFYKVSF